MKNIWTIFRILTFYIVGMFNTVLIKQEDVGTWKNYLGFLLLLIALIDTIVFIKKNKSKRTITK